MDESIEQYLKCVEEGDIESLFLLGNYYEKSNVNYNEMKKYYMMAINKGHKESLNSMLLYYKNNVNKSNINDALIFASKIGNKPFKIEIINVLFDKIISVKLSEHLLDDYFGSQHISRILDNYFDLHIDPTEIMLSYDNIFTFLTCDNIKKKRLPFNLKMKIISHIFF